MLELRNIRVNINTDLKPCGSQTCIEDILAFDTYCINI